MTASIARDRAIVVRPRASLMRNGTLSFVVVSIGLFGSLYFLTVPLGTWPTVLAIHAAMTAVFVIAWIRYRQTFVGVRDGQLEYQGFMRSKWATPAASVSSVMIAHTYRPNSQETTAQFLARDARGERILRMRGQFWYERDMRAIAEALGRELDVRPEPMTNTAFIADYPGSAFWFEKHPAIVITALAVLLVIAFTVVLGLMTLTGIAIGKA